jgi:hypothetical protein
MKYQGKMSSKRSLEKNKIGGLTLNDFKLLLMKKNCSTTQLGLTFGELANKLPSIKLPIESVYSYLCGNVQKWLAQ